MFNDASTMNNHTVVWSTLTGFRAEAGPLPTISRLHGRDVGQVFLGFILGVAVVMGLLWYRGGGTSGPGFTSITSLFGYKAGSNNNAETRDPILDVTPSGPSVQVTPYLPSQLRVKVDNLTLRSCAGFDCSVIATLPRGQTVRVLNNQTTFAQDLEWVRVSVGSREGWVSRYFLE